ncbi:MAG: hypothetical protein M3R63_21720 [Actinomycetota bacterium]|nr:hypothetical protein [Actinomycetota bacterium]
MPGRQPDPLAGHPSTPRLPTRYGPFARLADWWHATRDGKAGLPAIDIGPPLTPTIEAHSQTYQDRCYHEQQIMIVRTAELCEREARINARIAEAEQAALLVEKRLEAYPEKPTVGELEERRSGESTTDIAMVRLRRSREHAARRSPLVTEAVGLRTELQTLRVDLEWTRQGILTCRTLCAVRIHRLHAHTMRRLACYQRRLVRVHSEGARLAPLLAPHYPQLAGWVRALGDGLHDVA